MLLLTVGRWKKLVSSLYVRLFVFILLYLLLFVFIFAYNIQTAANSGAISSGYQDYYQCLLFGEAGCAIGDDITNYNLVMLKGFAISVPGRLALLHVPVVGRHRILGDGLFKAAYLLVRHRDKPHALAVLGMVASTRGSHTITGKASSMTITQLDSMKDDETGDEDDASAGIRASMRREPGEPGAEEPAEREADVAGGEASEDDGCSSSSDTLATA